MDPNYTDGLITGLYIALTAIILYTIKNARRR